MWTRFLLELSTWVFPNRAFEMCNMSITTADIRTSRLNIHLSHSKKVGIYLTIQNYGAESGWLWDQTVYSIGRGVGSAEQKNARYQEYSGAYSRWLSLWKDRPVEAGKHKQSNRAPSWSKGDTDTVFALRDSLWGCLRRRFVEGC